MQFLIPDKETDMTEERITETRDDLGNTHTHTTVIHDGPRDSGGAGKWVFLLILLVAVIAAIYFFSQMSSAEAGKDQAVADAAGQVGDAAQQAGDAVTNAANNLTN